MKYYYVPDCPRCGSARTGYYINLSGKFDYYKTVAKYMQKAQLIKIRNNSLASDMPNLFCLECGIEWYGKVDVKKYTQEDLRKEFNRRCINEENITEYKHKSENSKLQFNENNRKKILRKCRNFISKTLGI